MLVPDRRKDNIEGAFLVLLVPYYYELYPTLPCTIYLRHYPFPFLLSRT